MPSRFPGSSHLFILPPAAWVRVSSILWGHYCSKGTFPFHMGMLLDLCPVKSMAVTIDGNH